MARGVLRTGRLGTPRGAGVESLEGDRLVPFTNLVRSKRGLWDVSESLVGNLAMGRGETLGFCGRGFDVECGFDGDDLTWEDLGGEERGIK